MMHGALLLAVIAATASGTAATHRYGDRLLADIARADPLIAGLRIDARDMAGNAIRIVEGKDEATISVLLRDAMGAEIGQLAVVPRRGSAVDAAAIAVRLARHIYVASNLVEPDPFVPGARVAPCAQALVERTLDRFPDILTLSLHVAPLGEDNQIVASNFGRIGKPGDADDERVARDGAVLTEVTNGGRRFAVELPLLDRAHRIVGALSTSFAVAKGQDPASLADRANAVRDDLAHSIPSVQWLLKSR